MQMSALSVLVVAALLVGLPAQDAVDPAALIAEFSKLLERPAGTPIDTKTAVPAIDALLEEHAGQDLGKAGYVVGIRHYLARDYGKAIETLDRFFASGHTIDDETHRMMCARVYLNGLAQSMRGQDVVPERAEVLAERIGSLSDDLSLLPRMLQSIGRDRRPEDLRSVRVALVRGAMQRDRTAEAVDAFLQGLYGAPAAETPGRMRPKPATDIKPFTATSMSGKTIDLASLKGKVVLVDFWATWCGPCLREMPHVVSTYRKFKDDGFVVIGISLDKKGAEAEIRRVSDELGMDWEQIYDGGFWEAALAKANGISSIPATFLLDREGKVRHTRLRGDALSEAVAALLAERE
jgi:peroxiredoxin